MKTDEKKQITDIVNAFRLINKDIRKAFDIMSNRLKSKNNFKQWKKWEKGNKNAKKDYTDYIDLLDGGDWYYLNYYGLYNKKVIGFTFIVSVNYEEEEDRDYANFLKRLDENINKYTPMLCIFGIYLPIDLQNIKLVDKDNWQYIDDILQFKDSWRNYEIENIQYNQWLDVEIDCFEDNQIIKKYEGWYKSAKIKLIHITDACSKDKAEEYIEDLINEAKI